MRFMRQRRRRRKRILGSCAICSQCSTIVFGIRYSLWLERSKFLPTLKVSSDVIQSLAVGHVRVPNSPHSCGAYIQLQRARPRGGGPQLVWMVQYHRTAVGLTSNPIRQPPPLTSSDSTGSGSNAECHIQGKHLRLVYEAQGDDVKPTPFNALLVYAFGVYVEGAELYGWDTGVGTRPLQLAKNDYWLVFDELSSREQATWMNMIRVLAVIEHCYSIGHVQEFVAKIMIEGRRVATGRLFFKRDHRSVNSMF